MYVVIIPGAAKQDMGITASLFVSRVQSPVDDTMKSRLFSLSFFSLTAMGLYVSCCDWNQYLITIFDFSPSWVI
jgi:hypothetical protein